MVDVSIIIPTFNRARFLAEAIDSALAQGTGVEVIVVDDGSTDDTPALLTGYGERIRAFRQANQGPSAARNFGSEQAQGEYLSFLDSDDLLEFGAVQALLTQARRLGPGRIPFGCAINIDRQGCPVHRLDYGYPNLQPDHELGLSDVVGGVMPLCLSLLPRERYRWLGGLRPELRLGEDHEFAVRLHRSGVRYVATGMPVVRVRLHDDPRLSGVEQSGFGPRALQLWSDITNLVQDEADFDASARQALAKLIWIAGRDTARCGEREAADDLFALARSLDRGVERISPWPLRLLSKAAGPYRAERGSEFAKALLRRA